MITNLLLYHTNKSMKNTYFSFLSINFNNKISTSFKINEKNLTYFEISITNKFFYS